MVRFTLVFLFCCSVILTGVSNSVAESEIIGGVGVQDNKERLLIFTPDGPIVIELHINLNGHPYRMMREKLVRDILKQGDTDGDGKSTWKEAAANPRFLINFSRYQGTRLRSMLRRYDTNQNDIIERSEALNTIKLSGGGETFTLSGGYSSYSNPDIKKVLDTDKDGSISKREFKSAQQALRSRDANGNDLIEQSEVTDSSRSSRSRTYGNRNNRTPEGVFHLDKLTVASHLYETLQKQYSNEENVIEEKRLKLLASTWNHLDKNRNHYLDREEAKFFHTVQPHVIAEINLGTDKNAGVQVKKVAEQFDEILVKDKSSFKLNYASLNFELHVPSVSGSTTTNYAQYAKSMLQRIDTDKNGYVDEKELKKSRQGAYYLRSFKRWDANADGKVYADEIEASYSKTNAPRQSQVQATSRLAKQTLFALLDETGDGRISLRELRVAKSRLLTLDKNNDGALTAEEVPQSLTLTISQGGRATNDRRSINNGRMMTPSRTTTPKQQGPQWFVHMDKNGDGDISPKEFLGKPEIFKKLDSNHDGFIEKKEAELAKK